MKSVQIALTIVLLATLSACGFQLRGSIQLPPAWEDLKLSSASPNSELTRALRTNLENAGIRLQDTSEANYILYLGTERFERRNLTIASNARAAEFELKMSTSLRVTDKAGNELLPESDVTTFKVITNDPENISGKVEEARLLREEMREDLVQQLIRKLRFLATGGAGGAVA